MSKTVSATATQANTAFDSSQLRDLLRIYYKRLFPHKLFYNWLVYGYCKLLFMRFLFESHVLFVHFSGSTHL